MADKITYHELIELIEKETGLNQQNADQFVKQWIEVINDGLVNDGQVRIAQFGTFKLKRMDERPGINPQTMEAITIPERTKVVFKGAKQLKEKVNHKYNLLKATPIPAEKASTVDPEDTKDKDEIISSISEQPSERRKEYTPTGVMAAPGQEKTESPAEKTVVDSEPQEIIPEKEKPVEKTFETEEKTEEKKSKKGYWIVAAILIVLIFLFLFWPSQDEPTKQIVEKPVQQQEKQIAEKPAAPVETKQEKIKKAPGTPGGTHTVNPGDKLWSLSKNFYKDAYLWPNIYRVNEATIPNPDILELGYTLTVPPLEGTISNLTEKDSSDIALGFLKTYLAYKKSGNQQAKYYLWVCKKYSNKVFQDKQNQIDQTDVQFVLSLK